MSRNLKNTSRREHERHWMSDFFAATVAIAGYRGTKNTQIVHLGNEKGEFWLSQNMKTEGGSPR